MVSKVLGVVMLLCSLTQITFAHDTDSTLTDSLKTTILKAPEGTGGIDHLSGAVTVTNHELHGVSRGPAGNPA